MTTIIIIDDSKSHRDQLHDALRAAGDFDSILEAEDGSKGLTLLVTKNADAVICDLEMPGFDGEKLLFAYKSMKGDLDIPFIFATGSKDLNRRVNLLESGAQDVILKPFHPRELIARLRGHLLFRKLQRDLSEKNERLQVLSTTDPLTQLRNRRFVDEALTVEVARARRHGTALSLLMIDLDFFKIVNDEFGHPAGDEVLREAGRRIGHLVRTTDVAARYGGEEFLILLAHESSEGASIAAERWRSAIADKPFELPSGKLIEVTASLGVASFSPAFSSEAELIAAADDALYRGKRNGRNRVEMADGS